MTNYTGVQTEIIQEHRTANHRCIVMEAPLRTKHEHWIVAIERLDKPGGPGLNWVRVSDREFETRSEAIDHYAKLTLGLFYTHF